MSYVSNVGGGLDSFDLKSLVEEARESEVKETKKKAVEEMKCPKCGRTKIVLVASTTGKKNPAIGLSDFNREVGVSLQEVDKPQKFYACEDCGHRFSK